MRAAPAVFQIVSGVSRIIFLSIRFITRFLCYGRNPVSFSLPSTYIMTQSQRLSHLLFWMNCLPKPLLRKISQCLQNRYPLSKLHTKALRLNFRTMHAETLFVTHSWLCNSFDWRFIQSSENLHGDRANRHAQVLRWTHGGHPRYLSDGSLHECSVSVLWTKA